MIALGQPICFGYFFWKTEQAMANNPGQALPITTAQVWGVVCGVWCVVCGMEGVGHGAQEC